MTSPATSWTGSSPSTPPRHRPRVTAWNSRTWPAPGMTRPETSFAGGAAAAQGPQPSMEKKTAPVRRTEARTSVRGSKPIPASVTRNGGLRGKSSGDPVKAPPSGCS